MYETRQNKEKVSRRIDAAGGRTWQMAGMENVSSGNIHLPMVHLRKNGCLSDTKEVVSQFYKVTLHANDKHNEVVKYLNKNYGTIEKFINSEFTSASFYNNGEVVKIGIPNESTSESKKATEVCLIMVWNVNEKDYNVIHLGPLTDPKPNAATTNVQDIYDSNVRAFLKTTPYANFVEEEEEEKKANSVKTISSSNEANPFPSLAETFGNKQ